MTQEEVDAMAAGSAKAKSIATRLRVSTPKEADKRITKRRVEKASPLPITRAKMVALKRSAKARKDLAVRLERRTPSVEEAEDSVLTTNKKTPYRLRAGK